jgi:hypothetical protein
MLVCPTAVLAFIFLLLVVVAVVLVRALSRHKGEYLTQVNAFFIIIILDFF